MAFFIFYTREKLLRVISSTGSYSIRATSGRGACMNNTLCQTKKNIGPIPHGQYYIEKRELTNPNILGDLARNNPITGGDWGDWRVPIHPFSAVKRYGRSGFFMHGGVLKGSAGCIDVGGGIFGNKNTDKILRTIKSSDRSILWVY